MANIGRALALFYRFDSGYWRWQLNSSATGAFSLKDETDVKGPKAECDWAVRARRKPSSRAGFQISPLAEHEWCALIFFKTVHMSDNDCMVARVMLCV